MDNGNLPIERITRHQRRGGALRALAAERAGATAVEFAVVAPMLIALVLGILHVSLIFLAQQGLETAAENAGRLIMTGQAQNQSLTQAQFKAAACNSLPNFLTCDRLYVDVTPVSDYASAVTAAPTFTYDASGNVNNSFAYSTGTKGGIVVVRLMYLWPTTNGPLGLNLTNTTGGNSMLIASSVLKTEFY